MNKTKKKSKREYWIVVNFRPDYKCLEYFSGRWADDAWGRPVWGYYKQAKYGAKRYWSKKAALEALEELEAHRRQYPNQWHYPKSRGGYGLDQMSIQKFDK